MYLERIAPILRSGMEFLERDGTSIGCIFNRFMSEVADDGHPLDKTYSLSAWCSLASLEKWAKAKEHLAIFGAGTNHYNVLGDDAKLRLYHEMSVVRARDQAFEYFNCHTQTGMLNSLGAEELQANSHS
jgi:aldoxime dehydratase